MIRNIPNRFLKVWVRMISPSVQDLHWNTGSVLCSAVIKPAEDRTYIKTDQDFKFGKKFTVQTLEKLFNMKKFDALGIASKYKKLCKVPANTLTVNYNICKAKGITNESILLYPEILSESGLDEKIEAVKKLRLNINDTLPLLKLSLTRLSQFVETDKTGLNGTERIKYLCKFLEKPVRKVCEYLSQRSFLLHMDFSKLEHKVNVLKEYGIKPEQLACDLWVLRYSEDFINERLGCARKSNVDSIKTWMVRAPPDVVERYIQRRSDNKSILGNHSVAEYLSERLDCTVKEAECLIKKHPALENKSLKKMQEIIDFLYSYGFKPYHICRVPKILLHSVETTRKRLKELQSQGLQLDSLYMLTKSQKQYMQYYEGLVKANKVKNKR